MAEWTDPETLEQVAGTAAPAAVFNSVLDNLTVLASLGAQKGEITASGQRTTDTYGPLDDEAGPEVEFRTGPLGLVVFTLYAQFRVSPAGGNGFVSYEIRRLSDNVQVVAPSDLRSLRTRDNLTQSKSFPWLEGPNDGLDADETYVLRMLYRAGDGADFVEATHRRVLTSFVRPVPA